MVPLGGSESIPTSIRYSREAAPKIGFEAIGSDSSLEGVNEDFKIDLGEVKPGQSVLSRARFPCADDQRRSAYQLAADFFEQLSRFASDFLSTHRMDPSRHVLISEPLSFHAEDNAEWLENYRGNLRRILSSKFREVEFLPEPFAVYQYYRYGVRHSLVAQDRKHCALVIDFGGGTFDVSVVETSQAGDISRSGKHARPLGAHSKPVGGFEINRQLARLLLTQLYPKPELKEAIRKGFENFYRWREGSLDIEQLSTKNQNFLRWLGRFLRLVEAAKVQLSRRIGDWSLSAELSAAISLEVPEDPFRTDSVMLPTRFTASFLREVFGVEIWSKRLKTSVRSALERAGKELDGRPIDVVLLSGGSANLRWLESHLRQDFEKELATAHMVSLRESYQEVVAKGLAIECARRAYEPNSEFADVTYNPLYLTMDPDGSGLERKMFRLIKPSSGVAQPRELGQLLHSAESVDAGDEQELIWRVRLDRPPRQFLNYFFGRSPNIENLEDRYNFVQTKAITPKSIQFDSAIQVRLRVREDGTCTPTFVYRTEQNGSVAEAVVGQPFCIDLVSSNQKAARAAYVGIDFGTATSALSYVDWQQIELYESRGHEDLWLNLNELIDLATPIGIPIKAMLGVVRADDQARFAMAALEAMLSFAGFVCWADVSAAGTVGQKHFNANWKRSAGPLKKLLFDLLDSKHSTPFLGGFRQLLTPDVRNLINAGIQALDDEKHHKKPAGSYDAKPLLEKLGNACRRVFKDWHFGYFENVAKAGFSQRFKGTLRVAAGAPPFHRSLAYEGACSFAEMEAVIVNPVKGEVLSLSPLFFWHRSQQAQIWQDCMVFDGLGRDGNIHFKNATSDASLALDAPEFDELAAMVRAVIEGKAGSTRVVSAAFEDLSEQD